MRDASIESTHSSRRRLVVGALLTALGVYALVRGVVVADAPLVGLGSVAMFFAVLALGPVLVRPITRLVALPLRRLGTAGRLAAANADRNPRRSASTAAALTIGVTLVAGASMFASTASASVRGDAAEVLVADAVVRPIGSNPGLPMDVTSQAEAVNGVAARPLHLLRADVDGSMEFVGGIDLVGGDDFVDVSLIDGSIASALDTVVIGDDLAEERDWSIGERISIVFPDGAQSTRRVAGVIEQTNALPAILAPYASIAPHGIGLDQAVFLVGDAAAIAAVDTALSGQPTAAVDTVDDYAESLVGALDTVLNLVLGLLGLAVVIAVLGIATTIGLSVHERTRELGVLRAIGMERRQVRRSIRLEAVVIALFGTVLGLAMGLGFTAAAISTLSDEGFGSPTIPASTLFAIVVGAIAAGTLAAALPARTAARRPVLDAIATD